MNVKHVCVWTEGDSEGETRVCCNRETLKVRHACLCVSTRCYATSMVSLIHIGVKLKNIAMCISKQFLHVHWLYM